MECTVEYDGLHHQWAKSPIRDEQVLLHLSHGQTVPVVLMTCCLRAARFLSSSATRDSSNDVVADWHVVHHCARSNGAVLSDWGRLTGPHCGRLPDDSCPKKTCLGIWSSSMRTKCPTQQSCAANENASMPLMPQRRSTSVFGTLWCHLIPAILHRYCMWNSSSLRTERWYRTQDSHPYSNVDNTTAW